MLFLGIVPVAYLCLRKNLGLLLALLRSSKVGHQDASIPHFKILLQEQ